jgi:type 1 glutamine amidotransferase
MSRFHVLVVAGVAALSTMTNCVVAAEPLKVCILSGSDTYRSDLSLPPFAKFLEANYNVRTTTLEKKAVDDLPGLEQLDSCDVAFIYIKRMKLDGEQLAKFQAYAQSGRPIVAVRTASHAVQTWLEFDQLVLGGNYKGHHAVGPVTTIDVAADAAPHPILAGVALKSATDSLYKNAGHATDINVLLRGTIPGAPSEALAWTREYKGGRIFYTSLGSQETFENPDFRRMLVNALFWTARRDVEAKQ